LPDFSFTQVVAKQAIRHLKRGVFPPQNIDYFTVGREQELSLIKKTMQHISSNCCNHFFIEANYGCGKSHMLKAIESLALRNNFMVTHIVMDAYEHAFNQPPRYIHSLFENLHAPNLDMDGLWQLIMYWANNSERERLIELAKAPSVPSDVTASINYLCSGQLLNHYLLNYYKRVIECRHIQHRGSIYYPLLYEKIKVLESTAKAIGFNGLVILFDEVESIATLLSNIRARFRSYEILDTLCNTKHYPHSLFFFSITPDFHFKIAMDDNVYNKSIYKYNYLKGCQFIEKWTQKGFNVLTLKSIMKHDNVNLCQKLKRIHDFGYAWDSSIRITNEFIRLFVEESENNSMHEREIIKSFITILEILQQHPNCNVNEIIQSSLFRKPTPTMPVAFWGKTTSDNVIRWRPSTG